ncbi:hypothetical protein ES707_21046 [subsurface metagenome]
MNSNKEKHHRRSIRLKEYDYSRAGYYYVTICTKDRECLFGEIENGKIKLSDFGEIVNNEWFQSFIIRKEIELDTHIIMPNHIHAIVYLYLTVGANGGLPLINKSQIFNNKIPQNWMNKRANCHSPLQMKPKSLSSFISGFKSTVSRKIGFSVWQRNYYERIIRNEKELEKIRQYIQDNPYKWADDEDNPINITKNKRMNRIANQSLHLTAIPLRCIVAGKLFR